MATESQIPWMVAVIMPVRNEQKAIRLSLSSVLAQDYPADRLEVLMADGMSDDGTRAIVGEIARRDPRVRLVDNNQARIMAAGFNAALRFARGEVIVLLGGHSEVAVDLVREGVALLKEHPEAWCVGAENLTEKQEVRLANLLRYNLRSVRSDLLKEDFQFFWDYRSPYWARRFLDQWCLRTMRSKIGPMKRIARMLRGHRPLILNWFRAKGQLSSGVVESFNAKAKLTTRKAYGFRTYQGLEVYVSYT